MALENLRIIAEEGLHERASGPLGACFADALAGLADHPLVGEVRTCGLLAAIELVEDPATRRHFPPERAVGAICREHCIAEGLVMRAVRDVMVLAPPLIISEAEIDQIVLRAGRALERTAADLRRPGGAEGAGTMALDRLESAAMDDIARALERRTVSSRELVEAHTARIAEHDARLCAVIELNPDALAIAGQRDAERAAGTLRGPLHGIPVMVKDNLDSGDRMRTSAGSLALAGHRAAADSHVVHRLRAAGAVILGKTNLSEWANFRSTRSTSGWSSRGGQTRNPYDAARTPGGSSSGSAVAVAAGFCAGRDRHRDRRIDPQPVLDERAGRDQAHRRAGLARRHRPDRREPGYRGADGAQRRRCRPAAGRARRHRSRRSGDRSGGPAARGLSPGARSGGPRKGCALASRAPIAAITSVPTGCSRMRSAS